MANQELAWTLEWTTSSIARTDRVIKVIVRRVVVPAYWALYAVCIGTVGLAAFALWGATQTGVWHIFWSKMHAYFLTSDSPTFFLYMALTMGELGTFTWASQRIREAALAGDERLAPVAEAQPDAALAEELPAGWVTLGKLHRIVGGNVSSRRGVGCLLTIIFGGIGLLLFVLLGEPSNAGVRSLLTVLSVVCVVLALWFLRWVFVVKRFVQVRATAAGLGWVTTKRRCARWDEVQAFVLVAFRDTKTYSARTVYAIETRRGTLTWELRGDASDEERQTHTRLCRLVARYSGQSLRDLSNSMQVIADESLAEPPNDRAPAVDSATLGDRIRQERRGRGCRPWLGCVSLLLLACAVLLLALAGVILQRL